MTYILYAADPTHGTSIFKQHTFATLKDLTQWCVSSVFDEKAEAAPVHSTPLESLEEERETPRSLMSILKDTVSSSVSNSTSKPLVSVPSFDLRGQPLKETKTPEIADLLEKIEGLIPSEHLDSREMILNAAEQYLENKINIATFYSIIPCDQWKVGGIVNIMSTYNNKKCIERLVPETNTLKELRQHHFPVDRIPLNDKGIVCGLFNEEDGPKYFQAPQFPKKTDINQFLLEDLPEDYWTSTVPRKGIYDIVRYYSGNGPKESSIWSISNMSENLKKYFTDAFFNDYFTTKADAKQFVFGSDMIFFLNLYFKQPTLYSGNLTATSGVYWERLPELFREEARTLIGMNTGALNEAETLPSQLFAIYKFLQAGRYMSGWGESLSIKFGDITWPNKGLAEEIVMKIVEEYGTLTKPTAAIREFFVKLYTVQRYTRGGQTLVGSTDFLDTYVEDTKAEQVSVDTYDHCFTSLPLLFRKWLGGATTHKDCKAALESLGIQQVRRAEGQKYLDMNRVPFDPIFSDMCPLDKLSQHSGKWKLAGEIEAYSGGSMASY